MKFAISKIFLIISISILLVLFYSTTPGPYNKGIVSFSLFSLAIGILLFIYHQQRTPFKGIWIKPSNFMVLGLTLVCFQYIIDVFIGFRSPNSTVLLYPHVLNKCAIICSIGILSYIWGYISNNTHKHDKANNKRNLKKYSLFLFVFLQFISLSLWLYNIDLVSFITGAAYAESNEFHAFNYFELLFNVSTLALLIQIVINYNDNKHLSIWNFIKMIPIISWILITVYLAIRLVSGDRGPVIYTMLAIFYAYIIISRYKIKLVYLIGILFIGATFVSILGIFRKGDSELSIGSKLEESIMTYGEGGRFGREERTIIPATEELANSYKCIEVAINEVEKGAPFHYGFYQINYIGNSIPFFPSFVRNYLGVKSKDASSSSFITYQELGPDSAWRLGTSCIADFYLELSAIGVIIGMFLVGYAYRRFDELIFLSDLKKEGIIIISLTLIYASKAIYIPRSTFLQEINTAFLVIILLYINMHLLGAKYKTIKKEN